MGRLNKVRFEGIAMEDDENNGDTSCQVSGRVEEQEKIYTYNNNYNESCDFSKSPNVKTKCSYESTPRNHQSNLTGNIDVNTDKDCKKSGKLFKCFPFKQNLYPPGILPDIIVNAFVENNNISKSLPPKIHKCVIDENLNDGRDNLTTINIQRNKEKMNGGCDVTSVHKESSNVPTKCSARRNKRFNGNVSLRYSDMYFYANSTQSINKYTCPLCNMRFKYFCNIKSHLVIVHNTLYCDKGISDQVLQC